MADDFNKRVAKRKQEEAQAAFSGYVQSVAFNMTLSRNMIDALWSIRDWGRIYMAGNDNNMRATVRSHIIPIFRALERRGLVWHDYIPPNKAPANHKYEKLTRAGELMCELLVEAGLMSAKPSKSNRRANQ